jgi:membrane-associated protease RseP (regulator of RpoE activity)
MTDPHARSPATTPGEDATALTWRRGAIHAALFLFTVASVFVTATLRHGNAAKGWEFTVALMAILLAHEFGHYFAARYHRVPASLPYFIPFPIFGFLGTMGAVIGMPERIRSRNSLLDIGASGPLAGLVVALPVLWLGLTQSEVHVSEPPYIQEGQSLFYLFMKWVALGPIPSGQDVFLHPLAEAGWAGLLVTMINLVPFGQLDGGHIAYALFGERQNRFAVWVRRALLVPFAIDLIMNFGPMVLGEREWDLGSALGNSLFWLVWYVVLGLLARLAGRDHPPCEPGELTSGRRLVAWFSLGLFVVLFMPTPMATVP